MKYEKLFQKNLYGTDKSGLCYKGEPYRITGTRKITQSKMYSRSMKEYVYQYIVTLHFEHRKERINLLVDHDNTVIPRGKHKNKIRKQNGR